MLFKCKWNSFKTNFLILFCIILHKLWSRPEKIQAEIALKQILIWNLYKTVEEFWELKKKCKNYC